MMPFVHVIIPLFLAPERPAAIEVLVPAPGGWKRAGGAVARPAREPQRGSIPEPRVSLAKRGATLGPGRIEFGTLKGFYKFPINSGILDKIIPYHYPEAKRWSQGRDGGSRRSIFIEPFQGSDLLVSALPRAALRFASLALGSGIQPRWGFPHPP